MKATVKPLKSIRQAILIALNTHGEMTVDGMLDQIQGFDRKAISSNVSQPVTEQLATRRKDDFTGAPAYRITDLGKSRIKSEAAPVKNSLTTEPVKPVVKENLTTEKPAVTIDQVIHEIFPVSTGELADLRKLVEDGAKENARLHQENQSLRVDINNLIVNERELSEAGSVVITACERLTAEATIKESELQTVIDECNRLKSENMALTALNESMPSFGAAYTEVKSDGQQVTVEQFMVRIPKHKPFVVKSLEKARQQAMRAAKNAGKAEVFAMVAIGHAVRGAVWNQK